jgi:hypothetical protein
LGDSIATANKIRIRYQAYRTENQVYERKENDLIMSNITEHNTLAESKSIVRTLPDNAIPYRVTFRNTIGTDLQRKTKKTLNYTTLNMYGGHIGGRWLFTQRKRYLGRHND